MCYLALLLISLLLISISWCSNSNETRNSLLYCSNSDSNDFSQELSGLAEDEFMTDSRAILPLYHQNNTNENYNNQNCNPTSKSNKSISFMDDYCGLESFAHLPRKIQVRFKEMRKEDYFSPKPSQNPSTGPAKQLSKSIKKLDTPRASKNPRKARKKTNKNRATVSKRLDNLFFQLLDGVPTNQFVRKGLSKANGCFQKVYGDGKKYKYLLIVRNGPTITVFGLFFIVTLSSSTDLDHRGRFFSGISRYARAMSNHKDWHHFLAKGSKCHGVYAQVVEENGIRIENPPKDETLLVKRGSMVVNLNSKCIWDLQFGDQFIWIASANIKESEIQQLCVTEDDQTFFDRLQQLFKVKTVMTTYEEIRKESL